MPELLYSEPWPTLLIVFFASLFISYRVIGSLRGWWSHYGHLLVRRTDVRLQALFVFTDARRLVLGYLLALSTLPAIVGLVSGSVWLGLMVFVVAVLLPGQLFRWFDLHRRRQITRFLPDALSQIAGAMRAGSTFVSAVQGVVRELNGPLGQELSLFLREQRMGHSVSDALHKLGERVRTEEVELVITATIVAQSVGGNLAETLQRLADTLRTKIEMEGKIRALTAQGILQGRVVSMLPVAVLLALLYIEPVATWPIFTSLLGWLFLALIGLLQLIGALVIRRIVNIRF